MKPLFALSLFCVVGCQSAEKDGGQTDDVSTVPSDSNSNIGDSGSQDDPVVVDSPLVDPDCLNG